MKNIPDSLDFSTYARTWRPTWQLCSTQVLDMNLQPSSALTQLVPEIRQRPTSSVAIPQAVYDLALRKATDASDALQLKFQDITMIWQSFRKTPNWSLGHQYYALNRPRCLNPYLRFWPNNDGEQIFPTTTYKYRDYIRLWYDFLCKDNNSHTYTTLLKFGCIETNRQGTRPPWFADWWNTFGLNRSAVDPAILISTYQELSTPLHTFGDLDVGDINEEIIMESFIKRRTQWIVRMKIKVQIL